MPCQTRSTNGATARRSTTATARRRDTLRRRPLPWTFGPSLMAFWSHRCTTHPRRHPRSLPTSARRPAVPRTRTAARNTNIISIIHIILINTATARYMPVTVVRPVCLREAAISTAPYRNHRWCPPRHPGRLSLPRIQAIRVLTLSSAEGRRSCSDPAGDRPIPHLFLPVFTSLPVPAGARSSGPYRDVSRREKSRCKKFLRFRTTVTTLVQYSSVLAMYRPSPRLRRFNSSTWGRSPRDMNHSAASG